MTGQLFDLWPEQARALDMMRGALRTGSRRPQLQLPTGSGKTVIAAHAVRGALDKGNPCAFVVPYLSLINQTIERFVENGIGLENIGVMQGDHPLRRYQAPVQICSADTLAKRELPNVPFVIIDESHIQKQVIYDWMALDEKRVFVGMSATPWAVGMAEHYDRLLVPATIGGMIEAGRLCRFRAYAPTEPDLSKVKVVAGEYQNDQLSGLMSQKSIVADVVGTWLARADNRPTMVFAVDRAHAAKLHDEFASIGVRSAYIDAYTDMAERDAVKALFHRGEIKVVCSVLTMIAGIDWDVRCISFARPSLSPILFVQAFGRGLRTADGKDHLLFLDHSGVIKAMGLPTNIHFDELRSGKRAKRGSEPVKKKLPSPRECPDCGQIVPAMERNCDCGHVFKFRSTVKTIEGELEEVGADATKTQRKNNRVLGVEEKARFHGELKHYASAHGHLPGWASHKYKDRFGVWPNDPVIKWAAQRPPSLDTLIWLRGQITRNAIARRYAHA